MFVPPPPDQGPNSEEAQLMELESAYAFAIQLLQSGTEPREVRKALKDEGYLMNAATQIVADLQQAGIAKKAKGLSSKLKAVKKAEERTHSDIAKRNMMVGGGMALMGLFGFLLKNALLFAASAEAKAGTYFLLCGIFIFGIVQIVRGFRQSSSKDPR